MSKTKTFGIDKNDVAFVLFLMNAASQYYAIIMTADRHYIKKQAREELGALSNKYYLGIISEFIRTKLVLGGVISDEESKKYFFKSDMNGVVTAEMLDK